MRVFKNIGKLVHERRRSMNMSQTQVSMNIGFKNGQFISNIERGLCSVPYEKVSILCETLNIPIHRAIDAICEDTRESLILICGEPKPIEPKPISNSFRDKLWVVGGII